MSQTPLDKLKNVDWRGLLKTASNKVKQYTLNLSPLEIIVEDATNKETWGPHGSVMGEIAEACFDPEGYRQVFGVLARRLQENGENWRMCYKALLLLEFLVKNGPAKIADDVVASMSVLERLQRFEYKDPNGRDHGANVRHRAQEIAQLVNDPAKVREEREKAKANRAKYTGVSAAEMRGGGGFGNDGRSSFGGGGGGGGSRRFDPASLVRPGQPAPSSYASSSSSGLGSRGSYSGGGGSSSFRQFEPTSSSFSHRDAAPPASPPSSTSAASRDDALEATRARIEQLKMENSAKERKNFAAGLTDGASAPGKKKLTDVKVNPKIAASLGLKPVVAAPPKAAPSSAAAPVNSNINEIDLLGGLDDVDVAGPSAVPTTAAVVDNTNGSGPSVDNGGWDAFGDTSSAPIADPFAPPAATTSPAAATSPKPSAVAAAVPTRMALPEDAFSDLTGLNKPLQPMGVKKSPGTSPMAAATAAGAAGGGAAIGSGDPFGTFADFSAAPAVSAHAQPAATAPQAAALNDPFADLLS